MSVYVHNMHVGRIIFDTYGHWRVNDVYVNDEVKFCVISVGTTCALIAQGYEQEERARTYISKYAWLYSCGCRK